MITTTPQSPLNPFTFPRYNRQTKGSAAGKVDWPLILPLPSNPAATVAPPRLIWPNDIVSARGKQDREKGREKANIYVDIFAWTLSVNMHYT